MSYIQFPVNGITQVPNAASLPATANQGDVYVALDTGVLYEFFNGSFAVAATPGGSGADTALSNLTNPTAVNQDLLPSSAQSLGSNTQAWLKAVLSNLLLNGATSGRVAITVPATVASYNLTLPGAQGAASTVLQNDGTGILSWAASSSITTGDLTDAGTDGITVTGGTGAVVGSGTSLSQHVADASHNGYLSSTDWSTFNSKQSALSITDLTDTGTDGITVTNGTGAVIGASPVTLSQHVADVSHNGYLSSTDWSTFNAKQPAGNYITALTGDVTASGPGSAASTLINPPHKVYVDFVSGSDSTGTGSLVRPWKTLQFAYNSITPTINEPYAIYLSGGNNDSDASPITGKPNVNVFSDSQIQIAQPITISGGTTNDNVAFNNIVFIGALTWIRNDNSTIGMQLNYCQFFSGPVFKQQGSGTASINAINSVFVNLDVLVPRSGSFFTECTFLGSTTFEDADVNAYYEILGGYTDSAMSISGGAALYLSGVQTDEPFGAALTAVTTGNGTPLIQTDSASVPYAITGTPTINLISNANHEKYTPATPGNWSPVPSDVASGLDQLAASSGGGITALTGDGTATGPGSAALTLTTVNSNVGSFGSSTSIPSFTVNGKGLITAASGNVVIAPAGTLSGGTLNSSVTASSLTSVGTITTGVWNGSAVPIANGGTGQTSPNPAFNALSPMNTGGDLIYGGASGAATRLANGSNGQYLTSSGGTSAPTWTTPSTGSVSSVGTGTGLTGGPITTTGTISLAAIPNTQILANLTGGSAAPQPYTLTSLLDTLSNSQGAIIYRGASGWTGLSPGTSGQFLQTQGAAANPQWASGNAGTVTSVAMTVPTFLSVSGSPVTSSGTLAVTLSGTALPLANGGTGQTTKAAAFDALQPMTTGGDIIYGGASGTGTRLANGSNGQVLTSAGGTSAPTWSTITTGTQTITAVKTANYTVTTADNVVQTDASGGGFTVTLFTASGNTGATVSITRLDQTLANQVSVVGNGGQTIRGQASFKLATQYETIKIISDGTNWQLLEHSYPSGWTTYTLTVGATTTAPTFGTIVTNKAQWRRVGDSMEIAYVFQQSTAGTAGTGMYLFPVPTNATINTSTATLPTTAGTATVLNSGASYVGNGSAASTTGSQTNFAPACIVTVFNSTNLCMTMINTNNSAAENLLALGSGGLPTAGGTLFIMNFLAKVPISNWES